MYKEICTHIFSREGRLLLTFFCWDYDFTRAMNDAWKHCKDNGEFPATYEIKKGYWKGDSLMRQYVKPIFPKRKIEYEKNNINKLYQY